MVSSWIGFSRDEIASPSCATRNSSPARPALLALPLVLLDRALDFAMWVVPLMSAAIPVPEPPPVTWMVDLGVIGHVFLRPALAEEDHGVGTLDRDRATRHARRRGLAGLTALIGLVGLRPGRKARARGQGRGRRRNGASLGSSSSLSDLEITRGRNPHVLWLGAESGMLGDQGMERVEHSRRTLIEVAQDDRMHVQSRISGPHRRSHLNRTHGPRSARVPAGRGSAGLAGCGPRNRTTAVLHRDLGG